MKNIIKSFLTLAGVAAIFASCVQEAKPLASAVSVDKTELEFEGTEAPAQDVTVTADGDWFAVAPEWITVEPSVGSGETKVKVSVTENVNKWEELNGPRNGNVSFCYGTTDICVVSVKQKGENGLDASRQYSKIKTAEELSAGSYLIVFNYKGENNALKAFSASSETYYSYLYGDKVTVADDVIVMPNATNAYEFEAAGDEGFKIKMSNGRYLFQEEAYNSFYSTTAPAKADTWNVTFDKDGLATIKNVTVANKWMQWTSYGSAGAYSTAQDGAALPALYKDAKPASDEILVVPEKVSVVASATSASIAVESNKTWKVRCHDEWIASFTPSGQGNGTINLTFEANKSKEESKTASIQVIGETTNFTVEFVQNKIATSVAEIVSQIISKDDKNPSPYEVDLTDAGAVVSYVSGNNAFIEDKTGGILLYSKNHGLTAGQKIFGAVTGSGYLFKNLPEITSIDGAQKEEGGEIPLTELTLSELLKNFNRYVSCRILLKGVTVTDAIASGDRSGKIAQDDNELAVWDQTKNLSMPLGTCDFICFPSFNNSDKQLSLFEKEQCTYSSYITTLSVSNLSVEMGQTKKLSVTTNNTEGAVTYSIDKTEVATVAEDGTVTPVAEGEATVTVNVAAAGMYTAAEATARITVTAASAPITGPKYVKVASAQEDWSGKYLIVFGTNAHATIDGKDLKATAAVTILNDAVQAGEEVDAAAVTIAKSGDAYSILLPSGKYFGMAHNSCSSSDTAIALGIEYTGSGVKISGDVEGKTAKYYLYCNASYFRCYVDKSSDSAYTLPTLYKYED